MKLEIGDRVVITDKDHPWYGSAGIIEKVADLGYGSDWVVKLDGAYIPSCGAREYELRRI